MGAPTNGQVAEENARDWDNDPGRHVVDQLYEVRVSKDMKSLVDEFFYQFAGDFPGRGFQRVTNLDLQAKWQFEDPVTCLRYIGFLKDLQQKRHYTWKIFERQHRVMSADSFEEITEQDIKDIIAGDRKAVTKFVPRVNRRFSPCVDIGD